MFDKKNKKIHVLKESLMKEYSAFFKQQNTSSQGTLTPKALI